MKLTRKLMTCVLVLACSVCLALGITGIASAGVEPTISVNVAEKYAYNSSYMLPSGTINYGSQSKDATAKLVFPDGTEFAEAKTTLTQEGIYKLIFSADFDGEDVSVEKTFTVSKNLFTVNKSTSSVVNGMYDASEHDAKFGNTGIVEGAYVQLSAGDTLSYNKVIDLSNAKKEDIILNLVVTPDVIGVYDFNSIDIILTDAYDPNNYVTINAHYDEMWTTTAVYLLARANCGQKLTGWEHYLSPPAFRNDGNAGYPIRLRLDGNLNGWTSQIPNIKNNSIAISMDYAERQIHHTARANQSISTLVTDLDSSTEHANTWGGFTTGEVFISVKCSGLSNSHARFMITDIMGEPVTSVGEFDRIKPYIVTDFDEYDKNSVPKGYVGTSYKLFDSVGKSVYFNNVSLAEKVYYNYSTTKEEVAITDGKFTPSKAGVYTVEHVATDALGNTSTQTYNIEILAQKMPIQISLTESPVLTGTAGDVITLANVESKGGSGNKEYTYQVKFGENEINVSNRQFRATAPGTYDVTITATDYLGDTGAYEYQIEIVAGDAPVFTKEIVLPRYFISGNTYELPVINAYNFTDGSGDEIDSVITYKDSQSEKNARGTKIIPVASYSGEITTVYYTAELNGVKTIKEVKVPTIIVRDSEGFIDMEKLFYTTGGNRIVANDENMIFHAGQENATFDYINQLVAHNLDVRFSGVATATNFDALTITLSDALNKDQVITLTYTTHGSGSRFYVNGNKAKTYDVLKTISTEKEIFSFTYNALKQVVKFDRTSDVDVKITNYLNGKEFEGFESGKVNVSFTFEGYRGLSSVRLRNINGKVLYQDIFDFVKPKISVYGSYGGDKELNSIMEVPVAMAADVIDGIRDVSVTVIGPSGVPVKSEDDVVLKNVSASRAYQIKLSEFGYYNVTYLAEDLDGNSQTFAFKAFVSDEVAPVIKVNGTVPTSGIVGKKIIVPTATATDNIDKNLNVIMYLITPFGLMVELKPNAFIPDMVGIYTVRYYLMDTAGNITMESYDITVTDK